MLSDALAQALPPELLRRAAELVFASKTDLGGCMACNEAAKELGLPVAMDRPGLYDRFDAHSRALAACGAPHSSYPFSGIPEGPERQHARAMWLLMLAEAIEQGDLT